MSRKQAELLLAAVISIRATSYLFSKTALQSVEPFNLLAVRFLLAFVFLCFVTRKRMKGLKTKTVCRGMVLGGAFFLTMGCEMLGLLTTDSSVTSFLENTAVVIVPLLQAVIIRRLPKPAVIISGLVTMTGIGFLTLQGTGEFQFTTGQFFCMGAAFFYAVAIILTDRFSREDDPLILGVMQVGFIGLFSLFASLIFEQPQLPAQPAVWGAIAVLAFICTGLGFTLQPVAQRGTTADRAGLFCALNPLTATVIGVLALHENFGLQSLIGGVLVLAGILLSKLGDRKIL